MAEPGPPQSDAPPKLGKPSLPLVILGVLIMLAVGYGIYYARDTGTKVTEVTEGMTKVTTTNAAPSDALLGVALGVGGALILAGILWSRISSVEFAGAKVNLDSDEVGQAKDTVAKAAVEMGMAEPPKVATATTRVLADLTRRKAHKGKLDLDDYVDATSKAFHVIQQTSPG